jgi:dipeptide/tripeptide permease
MANPFTIVFFQLAITKMFGKIKPIVSIVIGTLLIGASMIINLIPIFVQGGPRITVANLLPLGSLFIVLTVALVAFGELFAQARTYEYIGALAPKGQEGLFLGYANLPMAIGALVGGPVGAFLFNEIMCKNAVKQEDGLLHLDTTYASLGWGILMGVGLFSAAMMWLYNRWVTHSPQPSHN